MTAAVVRATAPPYAIAVASGKGGVGKTVVTANLGVALARLGLRVGVIDGDVALGTLSLTLGVTAERTLDDVLAGRCRLADSLLDGPHGVCVVPAASGNAALANLTPTDQLRLLDEIETLDGALDVLLIDVAPGLSSNTLFFTAAAQDTLVVTTPEPAALADATTLLAALSGRTDRRGALVAVNMTREPAQAQRVFASLLGAVPQARLEYLGAIPFDDAVVRAAAASRAVVVAEPRCGASHALTAMAEQLCGPRDMRPHGGLQFFFQSLVEAGGTA